MTSSELKQLADAAAESAVARTFLALGVDMTTPEGVISTQKDFAFMRGLRYTVRRVGGLVLAGVVVAGLAWFGIPTPWPPHK